MAKVQPSAGGKCPEVCPALGLSGTNPCTSKTPFNRKHIQQERDFVTATCKSRVARTTGLGLTYAWGANVTQ